MRQSLIGWTVAVLVSCSPTSAQSPASASTTPEIHCATGEPSIIETAALNGIGVPRSLALWMCNVEKHDDEVADHVYTCPDQTRGHFYRGRTWLTLINAGTRHAINTIPIRSDGESEDTFDLPYRIAGFFYAVNGPIDKYGEGKPRILVLKDYNGDGDALKFALFEAESCTLVETSLFGYSKTTDRVIQYPIHLIQREGRPLRSAIRRGWTISCCRSPSALVFGSGNISITAAD